MKKIYTFLIKSGKVVFTWMILLVLSVSLYSFTIKGKVNYGDRCYVKLDDMSIKEYSYDGVKLLNGYLGCNTYYLEYESELDEKQNLLFLGALTKHLYDNNIDNNIHLIIKCKEYQMISTIVDYNITYTKSII